MKKIIFLAAAFAAIASVSCTKEKSVNTPDTLPATTGVACISAEPDFLSVGTRALTSYTALESGDLKIDKYDIAFFKGTTLVREVSVSSAGITDGKIPATTVTLPVGTYKVYVAANAYTSFENQEILSTSSGVGIGSYGLGSDPETMLCNLYHDAYDADGNLVQVASGTVTVAEGNTLTSAATATLQLKRRVARIRVNSIANRMPSGMDVELEAVYLSNAVVRDYLFSDIDFMSANTWYCLGNLNGKYYWEDSSSGNMLNRTIGAYRYDSVHDCGAVESSDLAFKSLLTVVDGGSAYSTPFNLYCYRNSGTAYKTAAGDSWGLLTDNVVEWYAGAAAPATQLVIAAGLGNSLDNPDAPRTMVYYPIALKDVFPAGIKPNYTYTLDITLNSLGSSDPSEHIAYGVAGVSATVAAWNDGGVSTVEM